VQVAGTHVKRCSSPQRKHVPVTPCSGIAVAVWDSLCSRACSGSPSSSAMAAEHRAAASRRRCRAACRQCHPVAVCTPWVSERAVNGDCCALSQPGKPRAGSRASQLRLPPLPFAMPVQLPATRSRKPARLAINFVEWSRCPTRHRFARHRASFLPARRKVQLTTAVARPLWLDRRVCYAQTPLPGCSAVGKTPQNCCAGRHKSSKHRVEH
jgi:hypothetical protein